jgi:hydrogenase maturation protein HypF
VLALGAHLKASACLAAGSRAALAPSVGDLDTERARDELRSAALELERRTGRSAATLVVDLHPDYASTLLGEELAARSGARLLRVQHHLAHAAAVLAEHGRFPAPGERAAALALDGTGLGTDGTAWGAEVLLLDGDLVWRRLAHGEELPLVGGEAAVREPWRVACAALALCGEEGLLARAPLAADVAPDRLELAARLSRTGQWPRATGAGRVFEAFGALLGLCARNRSEGEAAVRLEQLASRWRLSVEAWPEVRLSADRANTVLPTATLLTAGLRRLLGGEAPELAAAGFHATFASLAASLARRVIPPDVRAVALGGGCLVNRLLARRLCVELELRGLESLLPVATPAGDAGLSYGQAVVGAVAQVRGRDPREEGGP